VSEILVKKYVAEHYSHASAIVREFYLSGNRFCFDQYPSSPQSMFLSHHRGDWDTSPSSIRLSGLSTSPSVGSLSCQSSEYGDAPNTPLTPATPASQVHQLYAAAAHQNQQRHSSDITMMAKENIPPPARFSFSSGTSPVEAMKPHTHPAQYMYNGQVLRESGHNGQRQ
jgi:hypothetical protein